MRRIMAAIFIAFLFFSKCLFAQADSTTSACTDTLRLSQETLTMDSLLRHAQGFLGTPYKYSGKSPKTGFDCSGFVCFNFKKFGIPLPYSSHEQVKLGEKIGQEEAKAGDLIFFKGRNIKSKLAGHVGIVVEVTEKHIRFIHSAVTGGVRYDNTEALYYKKRFIGIRRLKS